jgi:hypothetical protein
MYNVHSYMVARSTAVTAPTSDQYKPCPLLVSDTKLLAPLVANEAPPQIPSAVAVVEPVVPPLVAAPVKATVRASWERGFKSGLMCADEMLSDIIKGVDSLGLGVALHDCKSRKWNELVAEMKGESHD